MKSQKTPMADTSKNAVPVPENFFPDPTTKNDVPRCTLTDAELLEKCREWITKLCNTGGRAWVMQVPARLNDDPDLLFAELTWRFKKLLRTGSGNIKNDVTILDEIAHKLTLFADVKILALLELPDVDLVYILNKIKLGHTTPAGCDVPTLEDAMQIGYYFNNFRESIKKLHRKTTKNDDTAGDFSQAEISTLIAKVHDDMEGRYNLTGEDLFNIHAALCKLQ